ncbi:MAG: hypothetical protein K2X29_02330 [Candidatus Obscuribacterales bacterium]|nr:hypothetical protein [Candidatus Obscuribacterales bacterium]
MKRKRRLEGVKTLGYTNPRKSKATEWTKFKKEYADGTFVQIVIWLVPISKEQPHGLKYRLHFGTASGRCLVRYDNEKAKGDHRHLGVQEEPYLFSTIEKLLQDFWADVAKERERS